MCKFRVAFLFPVILFFLFAFSSEGKNNNFISDPVYTHADSARIDSIVTWTEVILADQKSDRTVVKNFPCDDTSDSGSVTIFYQGKNVVMITLYDCGSDHGGSSYEACFIKGKLVFYSSEDDSWSFENAEEGDTVCCPTYDQTDITKQYFKDGVEIQEIKSFEKVHHRSSQETESNEGFTYYFDGSGISSSDLETEMKQWIKFANSKKSYAEFFKEKK